MAKIKDMTKGRPISLIVSFALPMLVGNAFQQLYSLVDTAVVGQVLGMEALAAVGAAGWLDWLVLGFMIGLTTGFSIVISQRFGADDAAGLRQAITMSVLLTVVSIIVLTAIALTGCGPILRLMNTPAEALPLSIAYSSTLFKGLAINMCYNLLAAILRALGNSRTPLIAMIIASLVNVVLDVVFVAFFDWGVAGAAGATIVGQACAAIFCFISLAKIEIIRPKKSDWRIHTPTLRKLLGLGLPVAGQNAITSVGGLVLQAISNGFGVAFVAGYSAASKITGLLEMVGISIGSAMSTYCGQNLGAHELRRIRTGVRQALLVSVATAVVCGLIGIIFAEPLTMIFVSADSNSLEAVLESSKLCLRTGCSVLFTLYALFILRSSLQGMGDGVFPILSAFLQVGIRIGLGFTLSKLMGGWGVRIADVGAWVGAAVMLFFAYRARINRLDPGGKTAFI